jgi:hypothetical protein
LLNLLEHKQVQLLLLNHARILGLNIEEDGDVEDTVADTEMVLGVEMVLTDIMVIMVVLGQAIMHIMDIMVIMAIKDIRVTKDLLEVLQEVMVVLMVVEEENGEIMLRNLKNKRCVLLLKSK